MERGRRAIVSAILGVLCLACGSTGQEGAGEASADVQRTSDAAIVESAFMPAKGLAAEDPLAETGRRERFGGEQAAGLNEGAGESTGVEELTTGSPAGGAEGVVVADGEGGGSALGIIEGGSETDALGDGEGAPKSWVKVHLHRVLGSVDRAAIARLITAVAKSCHRRALGTDPRSAGRLELEFNLVGDYKGPKRLKIGGEETSPKLASCLRRRMGEERWPTGHLDGVGFFVVGIDFGVEQGRD